MPEIIWKGNQYTNSSSREGHVPFVICDHVSAGSMKSMDNWFTDPNNKGSSAHFGVSRDGWIHQYVAIERMAWANGIHPALISPDKTSAQVVFDQKVNPNLYTVSIEHEGFDGSLTEEQFQASVWLHKYIRQYIRDIWGKEFPLDSYHVIGHFQINRITKPNCPGPRFPWDKLYSALQTEEDEDNMPMNFKDWQWRMLGDALHGLYEKSMNGDIKPAVITDYKWVDKAYKGQLSAAELAWLNTVVYARQQGIDVK